MGGDILIAVINKISWLNGTITADIGLIEGQYQLVPHLRPYKIADQASPDLSSGSCNFAACPRRR